MEFRPVWQLHDPQAERDALAFWKRIGVFKSEARMTEQLKQLCVLTYDGDELVGVSTAALRHIKLLNCRMAMHAIAVAPGARSHHTSTNTTLATIALLEQWSLDHPEEGVMGVGAIIQSSLLVQNKRQAVWPNTKLTFIGFTAQGEQFRVFWFQHATVGDPPKPEDRATINVTARF